jgi:limonene-1,2-epoxide hydrolase
VVALLLAGCGGHARAKPKEPTPESVVRAWSLALDSNDNEAAARLFAPNAEVKQGPLDVRLRTHRIAVLFNKSLPCSGRIVRIVREGDVVTATFVLGRRPSGPLCTGPGQKATAAFTIRHGKIVVWQQIPTPAAGSSA